MGSDAVDCENASLFGIENSNRNFKKKKAWGKNQFNTSFPAALSNYLKDQDKECVYIKTSKDYKRELSTIDVEDLWNINPADPEIFFSFEAQFTPYQPLVVGALPRIDLVIQNEDTGENLSGIEIKLTALPDHTTCDLHEENYGCEIVVRPDTIVYLACSIANIFKGEREKLADILGDKCLEIDDWSEGKNIIEYLPHMCKALVYLFREYHDYQSPLVLQPIWKTQGKSPRLADNCLDVFVWSNFGFTRLFLDQLIIKEGYSGRITRQTRTVIWLYKMLLNFARDGQFDHGGIIDSLSYNTKNDKAFAVSGQLTHYLMACDRLTKPAIKKEEIKNIILGGGQELLSPERRFDAIIFNSSNIFDNE